MFGSIKEGVHSYRIFDIAVIDVLLTFLLGYIIYLFLPQYDFNLILITLFLLGIIAHRVFCVRTTVDKLLF